MAAPTLVHLLCGPRSLSTAALYSFAQRSDTRGVDEPLYARWLHAHPEVGRPYRAQLLAAQSTDAARVLAELASAPSLERPVVVAKHIARQLAGLRIEDLLAAPEGGAVRFVFLLRDPMSMVRSWADSQGVHGEGQSLQATSLPLMLELHAALTARGASVSVVDADLLRTHPRPVLAELCARLGIPFEEAMLSWAAGPKAVDGLWARHWYASVHASSGFRPAPADPPPCAALPSDALAVYRAAVVFYDALRRHAIGVDPLSPASSAPLRFSPPAPCALADPRNADLLVWVGARLLPRETAALSVFDSTVQGGDAVWEGLRVYGGRVFRLEEHLARLLDSARALAFADVPSPAFIRAALVHTLCANGMRTDTHVRLTLSRGGKTTSSMNPAFNAFGCCLVVLPEWKPVGGPATYDNQRGVALVSASGRRHGPQCLDSRIHHCNLLNNILPKIQANLAGAADALMLDPEGFVAETNACNVFAVKGGALFTPLPDFCLPGVTRAAVLGLAAALGVEARERRVSLAELYAADEVFTTGTMGELSPVVRVDGRVVGAGEPGPVTRRLQAAYRRLTETEGELLPLPPSPRPAPEL